MTAHLHQLHVYLFVLLCLGGWIYALIQGGAPERWAAIILIVAAVSTVTVAPPIGRHFHRIEIGIACVDFLIFIALVALAAYASRRWTIPMASLQAVAVLCHVPILLRPLVLPEAYTMLQGLWGWLMMILLIAATWRHRRRLKRTGSDPSWRNSSGR